MLPPSLRTLTLQFDDSVRARAFTTWLGVCMAGSRARKVDESSVTVSVPVDLARTVFDVAIEHRGRLAPKRVARAVRKRSRSR